MSSIKDLSVKLNLSDDSIAQIRKIKEELDAVSSGSNLAELDGLMDAFPYMAHHITPSIDSAAQALEDYYQQSLAPTLSAEQIKEFLDSISPATPIPGNMTPDERWEYQKYIISSPIRWFREFRYWIEDKWIDWKYLR
jgi:hypothetical protein